MRLLFVQIAFAICAFAYPLYSAAADPLEFREMTLPVGPGAQEPFLFALDDGRVLLSWTEPVNHDFAIKMAIGDGESWSEARTVVVSDKLFVNWADFSSAVAFPDGTFAAHWLQENSASGYAYDIKISLSQDEGRTWGPLIVPHRDGSQSQHGFATLLPVGDNELLSIWLDAWSYKKDLLSHPSDDLPDAMQLRATRLASNGTLSDDILLDAQTCTCCQTAAAVNGDGTVLVAYRDRTDAEIRDISIVRLEDGVWTTPFNVHNDGWEISGCPVNGPAIDAYGQNAVVAWFTAANDIPAVKVAFSGDGGRSFENPVRVDLGDAAGRVDVVYLDETRALVTWVEWTADGEKIFACQLQSGEPCIQRQVVSVNRGGGSVNFPKLLRSVEGLYLAWSQPPDEDIAGEPEPTIRMIYTPL